jgi:electron-transferring-flavoprotein dehydrogenase
MDPRAMLELMPDFRERGCPIEAEVTSDDVYLMWEGGQLRLPIAPPPLQNHGNLIASLGSLTEWMAGIAESKGVLIATETPAASPLVEAGRVVGVRSGDKGIDKHGAKKATYQPGADCRAKVTVLCEGPRGTIAKALEPQLGLTVGRNPQVYSTGVKELWEMPPGRVQKGRVTHTMGFPLSNDTFGGGFIYGAGDSHWAIGFVTGLDAHDPTNDPHGNLQRFKTHPLVRGLIEGGKLVSYGAKAIPEGGYWAMPKLSADGLLLCGDSGGFLNGARLKGVHLAIKSGMLAAETAFECLLAGDFSKERLAGYEKRFESSWAADELRSVRNFHQGFEHGLYAGMFHTGVQMLLGGRDLFGDRLKSVPGHQRMRKLAEAHPGGKPAAAKYDGTLTFDKLADVYVSGTTHEEDQPAHLVVSDTSVCATLPRRSMAIPASTSALRTCTRWCPTRRSRGAQAPHQRLELRALQDLRHRRSLPDHYLDHARRRRRSGLQGSLGRVQDTPGLTQAERETGRVEAFSDGVFAIAITLLALELKVPRGPEPLARQLLDQWPSYVAFVTSFGTIGIMWLNHHRLFSLMHRVDHLLLVLNGLLMMGVTITPFTTSLVADHYGHAGARLAANVYSGIFVVIAIIFNALWRYGSSARRAPSILKVRHDSDEVRAIHAQYRMGPVFYLVAFVLSFWSAGASVAVCAGLALFFAIPPRTPA